MRENWNEIVYLLRDSSVSERQVFLSALQSCFRLLGWKKTNGSMKVNYRLNDSLQVDIALVCPGKIFLPLIFAMPLCPPYTIENIFYKLNCKSLILVGKSIEIYYCNDNNGTMTHACSIPLNPDDEVGAEFANLLQADKYRDIDFLLFCKRQAINNKFLFQLKKNINEMIENPLLIKSIVMEHFKNKGFDAELLEKGLIDVQFNASIFSAAKVDAAEEEPQYRQSSISMDSPPKEGEQIERESITLDNTHFSFDGKNYYSKRIFVLKIIKQYVEDHPYTTLNDLERVFPSRIISKNRGVVRPLSLVKEWMEESPDIERRFCMKSDEIITLKDGMQVVVHNQWGTKHFPAFLEIAKTLYNIQSDKPYEFELKKHSGIKISSKSFNSFNKNKNE